MTFRLISIGMTILRILLPYDRSINMYKILFALPVRVCSVQISTKSRDKEGVLITPQVCNRLLIFYHTVSIVFSLLDRRSTEHGTFRQR